MGTDKTAIPLADIIKDSVTEEVLVMLGWALAFFLFALVAALFGFGGIAGLSLGIAKILFFIFLIVFLFSLILGLSRRVSRGI